MHFDFPFWGKANVGSQQTWEIKFLSHRVPFHILFWGKGMCEKTAFARALSKACGHDLPATSGFTPYGG